MSIVEFMAKPTPIKKKVIREFEILDKIFIKLIKFTIRFCLLSVALMFIYEVFLPTFLHILMDVMNATPIVPIK